MTASVTHGRALRYAEGSARGLLHHPLGHYPRYLWISRRLAPYLRGMKTEMGTPMDEDETLDTTGLLCPLPVLKARKRLKSMQPGQVLRLLASDPAAVVDVPHFCAESGHEFLGMEDAGDGAQAYLIRRS